jgi:hypothetical protein
VRSPKRPAFERSTDRVGDLVVANLPRCAWARFVIQPIKPKSCEPLSPFANRSAENAQPFRNFAVVPAFSRRQHNARSQCQRFASDGSMLKTGAVVRQTQQHEDRLRKPDANFTSEG